MILQALTQYYEALLAQGRLSPPGWDSAFKVSYGLELGDDGSLIQLIPYLQLQQFGKKTALAPRTMRAPAHVTRSSGIAANFLCDTCTYLLGADAKGKPARAKDCFAACAALHREILKDVGSPAARAVLAFFASWQPDTAAEHPLLAEAWKEITGNANLVFCYDMQPVTEDPAIAAAWQRYYSRSSAGAATVQCLVTGKQAPLARLHPMIKGVTGAQSSGAALVSFNGPAFNSYGHEQGENAPVGDYAAFAYTTALNALLADRGHRQTIGDTTVVCWAEHGETAYQDAGIAALFGPPQGVTDQDLRSVLGKLAAGEPADWQGAALQPGEHFYFLGLAPNAARLSVRFFLRDTFGDFIKNLNQHYSDINIVRPSFDNFEALPLWKLLQETVNQNSRSKTASPQLAGDVLRAILTGAPYPATLLNGVHLRVRAEHEVTRGRAGIIKAYYLRSPHQIPKEVLTVKLNEESCYAPYVLGRLFSVLEAVQADANPGINATIKDKYFNSASATPASILPLLLNLAQKHLRKLTVGNQIRYNKQITELLGRIDETYPARMTLQEQGAFQLGYYHQTQKRYAKKEETENV